LNFNLIGILHSRIERKKSFQTPVLKIPGHVKCKCAHDSIYTWREAELATTED